MKASEKVTEVSRPELNEVGRFSTVGEMATFLALILVSDLRGSASTDTVRGFGCGSDAISTVSTRWIRRSQVEVGEMVVGRVIVDVTMYEIAPRSNCYSSISLICEVNSSLRTSMLLGIPFEGSSRSN